MAPFPTPESARFGLCIDRRTKNRPLQDELVFSPKSYMWATFGNMRGLPDQPNFFAVIISPNTRAESTHFKNSRFLAWRVCLRTAGTAETSNEYQKMAKIAINKPRGGKLASSSPSFSWWVALRPLAQGIISKNAFENLHSGQACLGCPLAFVNCRL